MNYSEEATQPNPMIARHGSVLIMRHSARLPKRCIMCNRTPAGFYVERTLEYTSVGWRILRLLFGWIATLLFRSCSITQVVVRFPICAHHRITRSKWFIVATALFLIALALIITAFFVENEAMFIAGTAIGWIWFLVAYLMSNFVKAIYIDNDYVHISGISDPYLAELPEWNPEPNRRT